MHLLAGRLGRWLVRALLGAGSAVRVLERICLFYAFRYRMLPALQASEAH